MNKTLPDVKCDVAKRMKGPSWEKEKRPKQERNLHPRVSEMKGKPERANKPKAEASAQLHKRFTPESSNGPKRGGNLSWEND